MVKKLFWYNELSQKKQVSICTNCGIAPIYNIQRDNQVFSKSLCISQCKKIYYVFVVLFLVKNNLLLGLPVRKRICLLRWRGERPWRLLLRHQRRYQLPAPVQHNRVPGVMVLSSTMAYRIKEQYINSSIICIHS